MLESLRQLDPTQPLGNVLFFRMSRAVTLTFFSLVLRFRTLGVENVPATGPLILVSNHQSHLDPPAISVALRNRNIVSIARQGLFRVPLLGWFLRRLGSIPINEKEGDAVAIRQAIRALGDRRCILIFPEGARTPDGEIHSFKRGVWLLLSRGKAAVLPVAIDGAYRAWPRTRSLPSLWRQKMAVKFGTPISHAELLEMGPDAALERLAREVGRLRAELAPIVAERRR